MPKKKIAKESDLSKPYHKKKAHKHLEQDELSGLYVSQMNGDDFEIDKDVEKSKRIDPTLPQVPVQPNESCDRCRL